MTRCYFFATVERFAPPLRRLLALDDPFKDELSVQASGQERLPEVIARVRAIATS